MTDPSMSVYLSLFLDELDEQLQLLNEQILELERDGSNMETIGHIFRAAHTLKGSSAAMGFEPLKELTHSIENVFDKIRNRQLSVSSSLITVLFRAIDYVHVLKTAILDDRLQDADISPLIRMLEEAANPAGAEKYPPEELASPSGTSGLEKDTPWSRARLDDIRPYVQDGFSAYTIRARLNDRVEMKLARMFVIRGGLDEHGQVLEMIPGPQDMLDDTACEFALLYASKRARAELDGVLKLYSEIEEFRIDPLEADAPNGEDSLFAAEPPQAASADAAPSPEPSYAPPSEEETDKSRPDTKVKVNPTVRVDVDRLEKLLNFVGELIIDNTRLAEVNNRLSQQFKDHGDIAMLNDISSHLSRVVSELQEGMMKTRMLPIEQLFNRFPRMMRDVALQAGKEIDFVMEGKETELDRTLIEEIGDPIIHILRNAADHGIESAEERLSLGKPRKGKLILKASHQENQIVISIADDGRGIDPQKIKEASIRKGFVTPEEANRMTDKELVFLIFHSGMSTASQVTELSGRGVGMDIVRSHIEKLNGVIDIDTSPGEGTVFTIRLPLTLAIIRSLLVRLGQSTFAIPLINVLEIVRLQPSDIQTIQGREVCVIRGAVFPLVRLHRRLQLDDAREDGGPKRLFVVVLGIADKRVCLVVDKTLGNQEIVIKSLGRFVGDVPYIAGSTILGDGNVALILDVGAVVKEDGAPLQSGDPAAQSKDRAQEKELQLVAFRLGEEHYAFDIAKVKEIITVPDISKIVNAPDHMLGMMNLRGVVLPVYDLRSRFGLPSRETTSRSRIIVIEAGNRDIGVRIDQVTEVVKLPQSELEAAPEQAAGRDDKLIRGVCKRNGSFILALNIDGAFGP